MTIWFFDQNRRVYGEKSRSPIWRKHWRELTVVKETPKNYVLDEPIWYGGRTTIRVPKPLGSDFARSYAEIDMIERRQIARAQPYRIIEALSDDEVLALLTRIGAWPVREDE